MSMGYSYAHPSVFTVFMHKREWSEMHLVADQYDGLSTGTGAGIGISSKDASGCYDHRRQSDMVYRTCHQKLGLSQCNIYLNNGHFSKVTCQK